MSFQLTKPKHRYLKIYLQAPFLLRVYSSYQLIHVYSSLEVLKEQCFKSVLNDFVNILAVTSLFQCFLSLLLFSRTCAKPESFIKYPFLLTLNNLVLNVYHETICRKCHNVFFYIAHHSDSFFRLVSYSVKTTYTSLIF